MDAYTIPTQVALSTPPVQEEEKSPLTTLRDTAAALLLSHKALKTKSLEPIARTVIQHALLYRDPEEVPEPMQRQENELLSNLDRSIDTNLYKESSFKPEVARSAILDEDCFASLLIHAVKDVLGSEFAAWQAPSIWIALKKEGILIPEGNKDKLMAALAILNPNPKFYWESSVFEKTCLAFNNQDLDNILSWECPFLGFMTWAIKEVDSFQSSTYEFDHDVISYVAAAAHYKGLILLPKDLSFAQERLNDLNQNTNLLPAIAEAYNAVKDIPAEVYFSQEHEELGNVQTLKLIDYYTNQREKEFRKQYTQYIV